MRVNPVNTFYTNDSVSIPTKKVILTEHKEVMNAINNGTLTVDGVTLELSDEVRNAIKEANEQRCKDNEKVFMMNTAIHNVNVSKQQGDAMKEAMLTEAKAMEIARRIARGGIVPIQDEKLLLEYNPDLYQMSKQAAILAKEHEEYESLVDEESKKDNKEYDVDEGKIKTNYQVQVEVSLDETASVGGVAEVVVNIK